MGIRIKDLSSRRSDFLDRNSDERSGLAITDKKETNLNALAYHLGKTPWH